MAFTTIDVGAAQANADVFAFPGAGGRTSGALPRVSFYYDADSAVAVEIYLAPAGGGTGADRVQLLGPVTSASESRFCYPVPTTPTGVVWHLFCNKPTTGGAGTAFLRIEWDAGGEGR